MSARSLNYLSKHTGTTISSLNTNWASPVNNKQSEIFLKKITYNFQILKRQLLFVLHTTSYSALKAWTHYLVKIRLTTLTTVQVPVENNETVSLDLLFITLTTWSFNEGNVTPPIPFYISGSSIPDLTDILFKRALLYYCRNTLSNFTLLNLEPKHADFKLNVK